MPAPRRDRAAERLGTWRCRVCQEQGTETDQQAALAAWHRHYRQEHADA